jgi:hypothetical protein
LKAKLNQGKINIKKYRRIEQIKSVQSIEAQRNKEQSIAE